MSGPPIDLDSSLANFDAGEVAACEKVWSTIDASGTLPRGRASHTATSLDCFRFVVVGGGECAASGLWMHFSTAHVFDARTRSWTELDVARDEEAGRLTPRRGHVAALWRENAVLLFGGTEGGLFNEGLLNDCWCLHVSTPRWYKLKATGTIPPARRGASACFSAEHFIVLGGYTSGSDASEHAKVYALDPVAEIWSVVSTTGCPIPAFALAGACASRSALYLFGGSPSAGFLQLRIKAAQSPSAQLGAGGESDETCRNLQHLRAVPGKRAPPLIETSSCLIQGELPSPRFCHGMSMIAERWLIVFGGTEISSEDSSVRAHRTLNDCFLFDVRRRSDDTVVAHSRRVQPLGVSEPQPRNGFSMISFGTKFVIFGGGVYGEIYYNDSWVLDLHLQPTVAITSETPGRDLGSDFAWLLESDAGAALADVSIMVGSGADNQTRTFRAHRAVLCARSEYFRALLTGGFREASREIGQLTLQVDPAAFQTALSYMYTGRLAMESPFACVPEDDVHADLALLAAVKAGNCSAAVAALSLGADPDLLDKDTGCRLIHIAVSPPLSEEISVDLVRLLTDAKVDLDITSESGDTALMLAGTLKRRTVVAALLGALQGARVAAKDAPPEDADAVAAAVIEDPSLEAMVKVLDAADQLGLAHLKLLCEQWLALAARRSNICDVLKVAEEFQCTQLRLICMHFMKRQPRSRMSRAFQSLPKDLQDEVHLACLSI